MNKFVKKLAVGTAAVAMTASAFVLTASAAGTVVVTPTNTQGWSTDDTRPGGSVNYITDSSAPGGNGALLLTTTPNTAAKAQYMHSADNTPLANVNDLSYQTKQINASFAQGDPSYQLPVCLDGVSGTTCNGFTTLVFEPYENPTQGAVINNIWQQWDVDAGQFWSSRTYTNGSCSVIAGAGGAPFYTLAGLQSVCPNAVVIGYGVNIGSNNPSYTVETDLVNFNGTVSDFEVTGPTPTPTIAPSATITPTPSIRPPSDKDACKDNGYKNFTDANGNAFKNQGQCVSYFNHQ